MNEKQVSYLMRGEFFKSVERLLEEKVEVMIGNHSWQNRTLEKRELIGKSEINPYVDKDEWGKFLVKLKETMKKVIKEESRTKFINYAHRGASQYCPENTFLSFYTGVYMGANGIETDVHRTKDGILVLFHDDTLLRMTEKEGAICDYTYKELLEFNVIKDGVFDKIMTLDDFLYNFGWRDMTFAIELKSDGAEIATADLIKKHGVAKKCVITSFSRERLAKIHKYAPNLKLGFLTARCDDALMSELIADGIDEFCPNAAALTSELVDKWHRNGFRVRAWGVVNEELMRSVYDIGADGRTVNFPDKLSDYIKSVNEKNN